MSQTRPIDEHSMHTRTCGELRCENVGEEVTLTGWVSRRRDHGGLIFCDLRDREGITQLTFDPEHSDGDAFKIAETMRPEWPIKIHGVVRARGEETTNTKLATGEIEVLTDHAEVLNTSVTPPFQIEDGIVKDASFTGVGCAISQASTDIMIDLIRGQKVEKAKELAEKFIGMIKREITDESELEELDEALALQNVSNMPARVKCAVLAWHTLDNALEDEAKK